MHCYDYVVVGGGIAGIATAEILSRKAGVSVLLLEKADALATCTTGGFHEWLHTGALYTLLPRFTTLKYCLGGLDDLLLFYQNFANNNLRPSEQFIRFDPTKKTGWFNDQFIDFRYRNRPLNPVWTNLSNRSQRIIQQIKSIDTFRRRAGSEDFAKFNHKDFGIKNARERFTSFQSSDFTINSRLLLEDLVKSIVSRGGDISTCTEVLSIEQKGTINLITTNNVNYRAKNVYLCCEEQIANFYPVKISKHFAPMFVGGLPYDPNSFVELDYNVKNCINLLSKGDGIVLCGGISCKTESEALLYLDYLKAEHTKRFPALEILGSYMGNKNEIATEGSGRGYIYKVQSHSETIRSIVLGKFSLFASMAAEIYRREFNENPTNLLPELASSEPGVKIGDTNWFEISQKQKLGKN